MVLLSSMEIINFPEYLDALAKIFKQAGISWTLASDAFEATNSGIQIGISDLAQSDRLAHRRRRRTAQGEERVISPECGHAYTAMRWEGPNLIGRPFSFEVVHMLEVLDELRQKGC